MRRLVNQNAHIEHLSKWEHEVVVVISVTTLNPRFGTRAQAPGQTTPQGCSQTKAYVVPQPHPVVLGGSTPHSDFGICFM